MATITETILYQYGQTAERIRRLKAEAYRATGREKYAYRSPDGRTFRNERPPDEFMARGWTYGKVKFARVESHMRPSHPGWAEYRRAKRQATLLMAARLVLKAHGGDIPEKAEVSSILRAGVMRTQARTARRQKSLAYAACRLLRKLGNRLDKSPEAFRDVDEWWCARRAREVAGA